jgi:hypothetical protein
MQASIRIRLCLAALGLAGGLASAQTTPALSVTPNPAPADQAFSLYLQGTAYGCYTAFSRESVTVSGDRIDLRYTAQTLLVPQGGAPGAVCPMTPGAGSAASAPDAGAPPSSLPAAVPVFSMPALKAGSYAVWATEVPACRYDKPACAIAEVSRSAGTLEVRSGTARTDWYLKERSVPDNRPFTMQLLRDDIGNCQTSFSHDTAVVISGSIYASFVMESHPERVCVMDIRPYGPSFPMPALKPGLYPVLPEELAACQVADPPCLLPVKAPVPTDTLIVTHTLAAALSALRAAAPRMDVRGGFAYIDLPAGATGLWRAELSTVDGRVLETATMPGSAGQRIAFPVDRAPMGGLSLIRLTGPDGAETLAPVIGR